mmetsp:Transcript_113692/g.328289  ORF Transcript_113692/g.328289 Transcript_113692/m.328289 type:complete len:292 (-) Transcript_113692:23-898(-)
MPTPNSPAASKETSKIVGAKSSAPTPRTLYGQQQQSHSLYQGRRCDRHATQARAVQHESTNAAGSTTAKSTMRDMSLAPARVYCSRELWPAMSLTKASKAVRAISNSRPIAWKIEAPEDAQLGAATAKADTARPVESERKMPSRVKVAASLRNHSNSASKATNPRCPKKRYAKAPIAMIAAVRKQRQMNGAKDGRLRAFAEKQHKVLVNTAPESATPRKTNVKAPPKQMTANRIHTWSEAWSEGDGNAGAKLAAAARHGLCRYGMAHVALWTRCASKDSLHLIAMRTGAAL